MFPAEETTTTSRESAYAMASASSAGLTPTWSRPKERLMTWAPLSTAQRIGSADDCRVPSAIFAGRIFAPGAMPRALFGPPPRAAIRPAMAVP